jgi:hypothetical protein
MRISFATKFGLGCLALAFALAGGNVACAQEKPAITVVFPGMDVVFNDLKLTFDLVGEKGDEKGFKTLKSTVETFLDGIDTTKPGGIRIYPTDTGLQPAITFPVKNDAAFKKLLLNLWDLDIKTTPPPKPELIRQVPPSVKKKERDAKLEKNERLIFKLYEGFLRYEPGHVNLASQIDIARLAKGPLPLDLIATHKLAALVDGTAQPAEKRKQGFEAAKKEMLAAIVKGENESEAVFSARKSLTEHQVAELERFFVESSKVFAGWNISAEKKEAEIDIDLVGLPGSDLEKSVELLDTTPDEFAGVSKVDTVFSLSVNFALDPLRQAFAKNASKLHRASLKKSIEADAKKTAEEKAIDGDLVDLFFDIVEGTSELGVANAFVRSWKDNGNDGSLKTVAAGRIPPGSKAKFEKLLATLASRNPANKLEEKIDTEGEIEIHKLTIPRLGTELPEFVGKDGAVYVGLHEKTLWLAAGNGALDLLKKTIGEVNTAGPKHGTIVELSLKMGPYIDVLINYYARNPATPTLIQKPEDGGKKKPGGKAADGKKADAKKADSKKADAKVDTKNFAAFISPEDLRKIAQDVFKQGKDTMTMTLVREEKTAKVRIKLEEGLLRFFGTALSKFVKENLED